jgi:hypothetical protein
MRVLGKPDYFSGSKADFPKWSFIMVSYCGAIDQRLVRYMNMAKDLRGGIPLSSMSPDEKQLAAQLFHILVMLCKDTALETLMAGEASNGFLAWRNFHHEFKPKAIGTLRSRLSALMKPQKDTSKGIMENIKIWERKVREYQDLSGEVLSDNVKMGILQDELSPPSLKDHLIKNSSKYMNFDDMLEEIENYVLATTEDTAEYAGAFYEEKGKGKKGKKGKGKPGKGSKEKKGKKGKGKGKAKSHGQEHSTAAAQSSYTDQSYFNGECGWCWKWGHRRKDCRNRAKYIDDKKKSGDSNNQNGCSGGSGDAIMGGSLLHVSQAWAEESADHEHPGDDYAYDNEDYVFSLESNFTAGWGHRPLNPIVDSGCGFHACPKAYGEDYPTKQVNYEKKAISCSGSDVNRYGKRKVYAHTEMGKMGVNYSVSDVVRPMMSVWEMVYETGMTVWFSPDGCGTVKARNIV